MGRTERVALVEPKAGPPAHRNFRLVVRAFLGEPDTERPAAMRAFFISAFFRRNIRQGRVQLFYCDADPLSHRPLVSKSGDLKIRLPGGIQELNDRYGVMKISKLASTRSVTVRRKLLINQAVWLIFNCISLLFLLNNGPPSLANNRKGDTCSVTLILCAVSLKVYASAASVSPRPVGWGRRMGTVEDTSA